MKMFAHELEAKAVQRADVRGVEQRQLLGQMVESCRLKVAGFLQRGLCDDRRRINFRIVEFGVHVIRIQKIVQTLEAASRKNNFRADDFIARFEIAPQVALLFGVRRPIGVAAFGRTGEMPLAIAVLSVLIDVLHDVAHQLQVWNGLVESRGVRPTTAP